MYWRAPKADGHWSRHLSPTIQFSRRKGVVCPVDRECAEVRRAERKGPVRPVHAAVAKGADPCAVTVTSFTL